MSATAGENPHAGRGAVLLDIGDDIGALVVTMPGTMEGVEVEIRPASRKRHGGHVRHDSTDRHEHRHAHPHDLGGVHHPHVAVVSRPVLDTHVPSLVFPELVEGRYEVYVRGTRDIRLTADVRGGEVTTAEWPR